MRGPSSAAISLQRRAPRGRIAATPLRTGLRLHVVALRGLVERKTRRLNALASAGSRC